MRRTLRCHVAAGALLGSLTLGTCAAGQEAPPSPPPTLPGITPKAGADQAAAPQTVDVGSQLADIVVTAQRRAERLEDVPMSITAVSQQGLEDRGVRSLSDLGQVVSGVQINLGGAFTQPAVRGVTGLTAGYASENNVAIFIDGFYASNPAFLNFDLVNLENVQVLKGPQGTLYGRNATGGAILLTTLAPSDHLTGRAEIRYGSFNDLQLLGYISGPIASGVKFSLAAQRRTSDGYYDRLDASGQRIGDGAPLENESVRAKLQADVTANLTATIGYNFTHLDNPISSIFTNELYRPASVPAKVGRLYDPYTVAMRDGPIFRGDDHQGTLTLKWKTGIGTLSSYTGYDDRGLLSEYDFDGSLAAISRIHSNYRDHALQQGVDLTIDRVTNLTLIVGGTYWDNTIVVATDTASRLTQTSGNTAWAVFGDATYQLTDRLSLAVGARYTRESRNFLNQVTSITTGALTATPVTVQNTFPNFSPRASIRYEIDRGTNVYASVSRGFRSGVLQVVNSPSGAVTPPVEPETITAYEIGFKTARRHVRFDTSAWYYDYHDLQVGLTLPNPLCATCGPVNVTSNAPRAKIYGVEGQATLLLAEGLDVNLGGAYVHARYTDFAAATGVGLNTATMLNVSGQVQDWGGHQMARAPSFSGSAGVDYTARGFAGGNLKTSANYKYTASYVLNNPSLYGPLAGAALANQQRFRQGAYSLVNGTITWTDAANRFHLGVFANNIFDKKYRLSRNGSTYGEYGVWAMPRQVGGNVGVNF